MSQVRDVVFDIDERPDCNPVTQLAAAVRLCPLDTFQCRVLQIFINMPSVVFRLFEFIPDGYTDGLVPKFRMLTTEAYDELIAALRSGPDPVMKLVCQVLAIQGGVANVIH
ncbi:MAG: hypothetical protein Q8L20_10945 [Gammaproteobacteria bacterium]|nr:hypothetical protein [Gammaproteobacteria bacterium]